jgi:chitinase
MVKLFAFHFVYRRYLLAAEVSLVLAVSSLALISLVQFTSGFEPQQAPPAHQWSMGYWTAWAPNPISDLEWGGLTHIAFVGMEPQTDSSLAYSDANFAADASNMIFTAHAHNVKVLLDVWAGPGDFNGAITNNLTGFVGNIMNVVNTYGFDGVDLDWESKFNLSNNTQLISALRAQLGTRLLNEDADPNKYAYWGTVQQYLDRVSVGTYDLGGTFNRYPWFNSPLHSSDNSVWSWDLVKSRMTGAGVPVGKLNMGIPFFGQIFSAGSPVITGPRQTWGSVLPSIGEIKYTALVGSYNISTPNRDSTAMVPWIGYSNGWISFDDATSIAAKVSYAQSNNLGGWIIWALDQDYFPDQTPKHPLLTAIKNAMAAPGGQ